MGMRMPPAMPQMATPEEAEDQEKKRRKGKLSKLGRPPADAEEYMEEEGMEVPDDMDEEEEAAVPEESGYEKLLADVGQAKDKKKSEEDERKKVKHRLQKISRTRGLRDEEMWPGRQQGA